MYLKPCQERRYKVQNGRVDEAKSTEIRQVQIQKINVGLEVTKRGEDKERRNGASRVACVA